jgi:hypothetical protein
LALNTEFNELHAKWSDALRVFTESETRFTGFIQQVTNNKFLL